MKNLRKLSLFAILFASLLVTSCEIINTQFGIKDFEDDGVTEDDISQIMTKYDEVFALPENKYNGAPCTISMVHWDGDGQAVEMNVINTMLKGFRIRYPNINVSLTILSDYERAYYIRLGGSDVADVFLMPDGDVMPWAPLQVCEDLDPYIENSSLVNTEEMYESAVVRYKYDFSLGRCAHSGTTIALPKDIGPMVMYYNKSAFRKAGINYPSNTEIMNIEDAFEMWSKLKQVNNKGQITMYGVGGLSTEGLVWSSGGDFLNENRTAFPTDPETLAGLKAGFSYMQRSYVDVEGHEYCQVQPPASWSAGSDASKLFSNQMLACFIGLKSKVTQFRKLNFDWDVCPVPANDVSPEKNAWSGSVGYSMFKDSLHKEAAWKLIEYIASKEGQELLSATGFQIPVYPELAEQPDFIERESNNMPANFACFLAAAEFQPIGLWSYHRDQLWKQEGYDLKAEKLFADDPNERLTVDDYLEEVRVIVNQKLSH